MVEEISDFYKDKGFIRVYINTNKEPRRVATLLHESRKLYSMSYAKYLYTSYYKVDVPKGLEIDHINGDRMDDRIENLQAISAEYNRKKDLKGKEMVELICPVCKCKFLYEKRSKTAVFDLKLLIFTLIFDIAKPESRRERCGGTCRKGE